ncbi:M20 family metallopeptidase [Paenalcaligenes niemegkensis]|uniref:M20 aminoacylase family protein n=1 Tax=Paenalcaligenes niemegkensis TaxID=2895469 RepID=UPI001EE90AE7|nr:M20 aminoacylase family protein [Paenalcaligenes niemegkensis]MCQ9616185.1 M20 family metallopeptidase [Paenalcaligenes niemegkensis]
MDATTFPSVELLTQWRRDFHRHPETAFEEFRTSEIVAERLRQWGLEVTTGIAGTGVVGTLRGSMGAGRNIGLRADMDALHVHEKNDFEHASSHQGRMHACGHDGHTTMLLGAAQALSANPDFYGTIHFIFQPAEENEGGARVMIEEGLFERFPVDAVYALHNWPGLAAGEAAVHSGPVMAAFDIFDLTLKGSGAHAAMPYLGKDTLLISCQLVSQLASLISREFSAHQPAVFTVTSFNAGDTYNVMPQEVRLRGTVRCFDMQQRAQIEKRFNEYISAYAQLHDIEATLDYRVSYPATINALSHVDECAAVLADILGPQNVHRDLAPSMASEDFSFMSQNVPGVYIWLGNGEDSASLHNPSYDFNDGILENGVKYFVELSRRLLAEPA